LTDFLFASLYSTVLYSLWVSSYEMHYWTNFF